MDSVLYLKSHCHSPPDMRNSLPVFVFFGTIQACIFSLLSLTMGLIWKVLVYHVDTNCHDKLALFLCFYRPLPVQCFEIWFNHFSVVFAIHNFHLSGLDGS